MSASHGVLRAVVSRAAMHASTDAALSAGGTTADLRADAYGHGVIETARVAATAGVESVIVDDISLVAALADLGLRADVTGSADIDPNVMYGLVAAEAVPPMRLSGRVLSTKRAEPGEGVSYGYTHVFARPTTVALVTGGYAQGIVRALGNRAEVEIEGQRHPIVGRVAMDVCVVDLETADAAVAARLEDADVVYFGGTGPARENLTLWAEMTEMTTAELISVVGAKAVREWTS
ncbi:alanine racemase C-terminal domain-containing protein [Microbacterium sp.]|uniref:alanine racemase C-terminal domain-containing protein n=1 Tax=Microbacterium sp. TaxID=51671 RepID=UPI002605053A|nr:alanine racemase C-terminal domain-containing protein [Microbacterium sp.]